MQAISSSYDKARCSGLARGVARNSGTSAIAQAMKPFMSQLPRAYSRPSRSVRVKGSLDQSWPSTGTVSVWPDRAMPPCVPPSCAGRVQNRLALVPSALLDSQGSSPRARRSSRTVSIRPRLELRLVVSMATRRASQSWEVMGNPVANEG